MKLNHKLILLSILLVAITIAITGHFVLETVEKQNYQEADQKIAATIEGVKTELELLQSDYKHKVNAFANSGKIALPTYILEKYNDFDYFTPSILDELTNSIVESTLLFNLALNFDAAEVRRLNKELIIAIEDQRQVSESLVLKSDDRYLNNQKSVMFLRDGNKFLLQAQAPIIWEDQKVGLLVLKKYIDENYLAALQKVKGINISIIADKQILSTTMAQPLPDYIYNQGISQDIFRNVMVQGDKYNFGYYKLQLENTNQAAVIVGLPIRGTVERLIKTKENIVTGTILSIMLVMVIVVIYSKRFTKPIADIIKATKEVKAGNFNNKVDYNSKDEIGELVLQFNEMASSLRNYRDDLSRLQEFQENILESIKEGMVVIDRDGYIQSINTAMEQFLFGYKDEYLNMHINKMPVFKKLDNSFWEVLQTDGQYVEEEYTYHSSKKTYIFNLKIYSLTKRNKITGAVFIMEEISRKVELEKQLLLNDKLTSIGRFTAGIAHEINNPLGTIGNFVETILYDEENDQKREYLENIRSETKRISLIVNGLLNFSRQSKAEFGLVDIKEVVELSLKICQYQKGYKNFKIKKLFPVNIPYIMGNFNQIQQVFINIIINAFQSMQEGDQLEISVKLTADHNILKVKFVDTGRGIEPLSLQKIFDPFYTTKEEGNGVGLGLSISYGIVKNHGGDINVESEFEKGSTFTVSLPVYQYKG